MFHQGSCDAVDRPLNHPMDISPVTRNLISCTLSGNYAGLFKCLIDHFLPFDDRGQRKFTVNLGSGHMQELPIFHVQKLEHGESIAQLILEGITMVDNAQVNLKMLEKGIPDLPDPLCLLYKAKLASISSNQEECKRVNKKCKDLLVGYPPGKHRSWLKHAVGLTARHVADFVDGWNSKIHYHKDAYNDRNDCCPKSDLECALKLVDLTKAKQSLGFAYAHMGTTGDFHPCTKMEYNSKAFDIHAEAIQEGVELLRFLGMQKDSANPSTLMTLMRYEGMLRKLRIMQTQLLLDEGKLDEAEISERIQKQVHFVVGERERIMEILDNASSDANQNLLKTLSGQFCDLLINVRKRCVKGFTLENPNI